MSEKMRVEARFFEKLNVGSVYCGDVGPWVIGCDAPVRSLVRCAHFGLKSLCDEPSWLWLASGLVSVAIAHGRVLGLLCAGSV